MDRLYLKLFAAFALVVLVAVAVTAGVGHLLRDDDAVPPSWRAIAELVVQALPPPDAPPAEQARALAQQSEKLGVGLRLWDAGGRPVAAARLEPGRALPADAPWGWFHESAGPGVRVRVGDGRTIAAVFIERHRWGRGARHIGALVLLGGLMAAGCYPVARRITRRLEALQRGVEELGRGDLNARVEVEGRDEVARLAERFNEAAARIAALVAAQDRVLAHASHELRSPLARLRVALALLAEGKGGAEALAEAERDIEELDALVGDLLLASRLKSGAPPARVEEVDLRALLAEEAARAGVSAAGAPALVRGEPALLRRLVRNLLENAQRHAGGAGVEAMVEPTTPGRARLEVRDRGPGVPAEDRERIFEPFYRRVGHSDADDGGAGLGLSLVREIAARHHGSARCEPREGGGSRFVVELG